MTALAAPLHWHEVTRSEDALPFIQFFDLDPSENPTVRPPTPRLEGLGSVPGERGLVVVARTLPFERGLLVVGRQKSRATRLGRLDAANDVA